MKIPLCVEYHVIYSFFFAFYPKIQTIDNKLKISKCFCLQTTEYLLSPSLCALYVCIDKKQIRNEANNYFYGFLLCTIITIDVMLSQY